MTWRELFAGRPYGMGVADARGSLTREAVLAWSELDLHRLVAHFLRLRFPILLALNKVRPLHSSAATCATG